MKVAANTVAHILERKEYTGCLVNFKTTMQSYKVHKVIYNPEDEQAVFENAHEPIIDKITWERV
jgi:site-specific DNA recombinase